VPAYRNLSTPLAERWDSGRSMAQEVVPYVPALVL
jgi:hypothetical protein